MIESYPHFIYLTGNSQFGNLVNKDMKKRSTKEKELRDERIYRLYTEGSYTVRGLANLFRMTHPNIFRIVKKIEKQKQLKKEEVKN